MRSSSCSCVLSFALRLNFRCSAGARLPYICRAVFKDCALMDRTQLLPLLQELKHYKEMKILARISSRNPWGRESQNLTSKAQVRCNGLQLTVQPIRWPDCGGCKPWPITSGLRDLGDSLPWGFVLKCSLGCLAQAGNLNLKFRALSTEFKEQTSPFRIPVSVLVHFLRTNKFRSSFFKWEMRPTNAVL